jgi:hypothetical protein
MLLAVSAVLVASLCAPPDMPLQLEGRIVSVQTEESYGYPPYVLPAPFITSVIEVDYVSPVSGLHTVSTRTFFGPVAFKIGDPFILESGVCSGFNRVG